MISCLFIDALGMYPAIRSIIDTAECYRKNFEHCLLFKKKEKKKERKNVEIFFNNHILFQLDKYLKVQQKNKNN